jgi:GTPase
LNYGKDVYFEPADKFAPELAVIFGVQLGHQSDKESHESLNELEALAEAAGGVVVGRHMQKRDTPDPKHYIGSGKVNEIAADVKEHSADLIIFDDDLSPAQARNIEKKAGVRVLDRSGLILDIFANRARSKESRLQVELAQLEYLMPRLTRAWTHLERQAGTGGAGAAAGGGAGGAGGGGGGGGAPIGLRGPGETQLETDRRLITTRIAHLKRQLEHIERVRRTQRSGRDNLSKIALVGYTNAGKSTLMNALTGADVYIEDQLFATLDSTTRSFQLAPNKQVVLTDTVGFIRKLPHHLVASFRSTLAEASEADIVLHVVDVSHPNALEHVSVVREVLKELEIDAPHTILVMNKIDRLRAEDPPRDVDVATVMAEGQPHVDVSAVTGEGLDRLRDELAACIEIGMVETELRIPQANGKLISSIHDCGEVLSRRYESNDVILTARLRRSDALIFEAQLQ